MKSIGYKTEDATIAVAEERVAEMMRPQKSYTIDEIMQMEAQKHTIKVIDEYMNPYAYPLINGVERDEWLLDRLKKIRQKYILPAF